MPRMSLLYSAASELPVVPHRPLQLPPPPHDLKDGLVRTAVCTIPPDQTRGIRHGVGKVHSLHHHALRRPLIPFPLQYVLFLSPGCWSYVSALVQMGKLDLSSMRLELEGRSHSEDQTVWTFAVARYPVATQLLIFLEFAKMGTPQGLATCMGWMCKV